MEGTTGAMDNAAAIKPVELPFGPELGGGTIAWAAGSAASFGFESFQADERDIGPVVSGAMLVERAIFAMPTHQPSRLTSSGR